MTAALNHCVLCGLMCPTKGASDALLQLAADCPRRQRFWPPTVASGDLDYAERVGRVAERLGEARRPLVWIDGCDVATARACVALAQSLSGTVHVGQTTATQALKSLQRQRGWLGTSLAEVRQHAELVITLGNGVATESPQLYRLAVAGKNWVHIGEQLPTGWPTPSLFCPWPKGEWYSAFSRLLLALRGEAAPDPMLSELCEQLRMSSYSAIVWDADEFCESIDQLSLRRLLAIGRDVSQTRRCRLLCLESNPGRATAEQVVLWLTGRPTTARFDGRSWSSPAGVEAYTLEQWQVRYDAILLVRTVSLPLPLPDLRGTMKLVSGPVDRDDPLAIPVAHVGLDATGQLSRGDHAVILNCTGAMSGGGAWEGRRVLSDIVAACRPRTSSRAGGLAERT